MTAAATDKERRLVDVERAYEVVFEANNVTDSYARKLIRNAVFGLGQMELSIGKGERADGGRPGKPESSAPGTVPHEYADAIEELEVAVALALHGRKQVQRACRRILHESKRHGVTGFLIDMNDRLARMDAARDGAVEQGRTALTDEMIELANYHRQHHACGPSAICGLLHRELGLSPRTFWDNRARGRRELARHETGSMAARLAAAVDAKVMRTGEE